MTKAKTKGQRRRGRPCKPDVARNDNGRISQAKEPGEAPDKLAKLKRLAMFGGTMEDAGSQERGTVIGRMKISKELTTEQHGALQRYGELAERYAAVMQVPDSLRSKGGGSVMSIPDDSVDIETRRKWRDVQSAIREGQSHYNGNLYAALTFIVIRDEFHEHMIGDARMAANVLVRYYGLS